MKAKRIFLTLLVLFNINSFFAQEIEWQNTIGGNSSDYFRSISQTGDGGYILGGNSWSDISGDKTENSQGNGDYWVVKLDASGVILWQNTIGGADWDQLIDISQTTDGGYILGGSSESSISGDKTENSQGGSDYWVVKLDTSGVIQWQNTIGGDFNDYFQSFAQTTDGGYILGGYSNSNISGDKTENSVGSFDYWVVKLDASGVIQWQNTIGGNDADQLFSISQTTDGGYMLGGYSRSNISGDKTENSLGSFDYWVVKLDASGVIQWQNTIGGNAADQLFSISQTTDGGYILGGSSLSINSGDKTEIKQGFQDYWVVKIDASGIIQWQNTIGGNGDDLLYSISQTADGGYILGGWSDSPISGDKTENSQGAIDYWVVKLDASGIIVWQNTIGGADWDQLNAISQTTDGGFILGGSSNSVISGDKTENSNGDYCYWVVKLTNRFNLIQGIEYFDLNNNNIKDPVEPPISYRKVHEVNTDQFAITNENGFYSMIVLDSGNFQVTPTLTNTYYSTTPVSYNINFSSILQIDSLNDFGFQPNGVFNDLCVSITPTGNFRSGVDASYIINYSNQGTTTINATVVFYPDINLTYVSSSIIPTTQSQDSIVFSIGSLTPFSNGQIVITINLNLGLPIGSLINSSVNILPISGDVNPNCNQGWWEVFTTGAVDPNDILVSRNTIYDYELPSPPWLEYLIRFQNTGNDTAFFVRIDNQIPIDLQLSEFEFISTSHPCSIEYQSYESTMKFTFNNILLPDSNVNEVMSHGFIRYRIKPQSILMVGNSIKNKAGIIFDYNAPVQTNTAITEIIQCPSVQLIINPIACHSYTSPSGNYTWTDSGTYMDTVNYSFYCDSIYVINLIIHHSDTSMISPSACNSYTSPSGLNTWVVSGNYTDTISTVFGCDSVIFIDLTVHGNDSSFISPIVCNSYSSPSGLYTWTNSGAYTDTVSTVFGCDSVIFIDLTVHGNDSSFISPIVCDSYASPSGLYTWTNSGAYTDTISTVFGCDSIIFIDLTVHGNDSSFISPIVCDLYASPSGLNTWTVSGTYSDTLSTVNGCDSVITINLTVYHIDTTVQILTNTLQANISGGSYQWLDCNIGYVPIVGATNQSFTPTVNGNYAVLISNGLCSDTSSCHEIILTGLNDYSPNSTFSINPNPVESNLIISLNSETSVNIKIELFDTFGRLIELIYNGVIHSGEWNKEVNMSDLNSGIYYIMTSGDINAVKRCIKY
jgi:type IX secretion system substrate protein